MKNSMTCLIMNASIFLSLSSLIVVSTALTTPSSTSTHQKASTSANVGPSMATRNDTFLPSNKPSRDDPIDKGNMIQNNVNTTSQLENPDHKSKDKKEGHHHSDHQTLHLEENEGIHLFHFDFKHVQVPFMICVWVLIASIAKIVFHHYHWLSSTIPESCVLILLGIPIGFIADFTEGHTGAAHLSSGLFFLFLLPPIILDAGYFMTSEIFYHNIGTILLYAICGTIFNTFMVGVSLYEVSSYCNVNMSLLKSLEFGSLISAVDPVAVLAVFEEVQVNEVLYMLVFGESVLNDAASVVLYRTFEHLPVNIDAKQVGLAIGSFLLVSFGGTMIGIVFAITSSLITKFTEHVLVIEPVFVFIMSYLAYLTAEMFHFSGIMSILFCGLVMKPYVESNVSRKSHTTIKYFLKLLSTSSEAIIFMFLGESLVQLNHEFNFAFVMFTLLFCTVFRAIGVATLTGFANRFGRLEKVKKVEQFIMSYGGLRGAVAFCLAILLQPEDCSIMSEWAGTKECKLKGMLVTTTITVVCFTVFVQGCTIKKLVDVLGVKKSSKRDKTMGETVNDRVLGYMVAGVEVVLGLKRNGFWLNLCDHFNRKHLRRWLTRDPDLALDEKLVATQRAIAFNTAMSYADKPNEIVERVKDGERLEEIRNNASAAMQLAILAQETPGYDGGFIDVGVLSAAPFVCSQRPLERAYNNCNDIFNPRVMSKIIPKARPRRRVRTRHKYNIEDDDDENDRQRRHQQHHFHMGYHDWHAKSKSKNSSRRHSSHRERHRSSGGTGEEKKSLIKEEYKVGEEEMKTHVVDIVAEAEEKKTEEEEDKTTNKKSTYDSDDSHSHHHNHHHNHHKHKHRHSSRRRQSESLPTVSDPPLRDVRCKYEMNGDVIAELASPQPHTPTDMCTNPLNNEGGVIPPCTKLSRQGSAYDDTPLLDHTRQHTPSGRDKVVLLEAQMRHCVTENNLEVSRINSTGSNERHSIEIMTNDTHLDYTTKLLTSSWSSPHVVGMNGHASKSERSYCNTERGGIEGSNLCSSSSFSEGFAKDNENLNHTRDADEMEKPLNGLCTPVNVRNGDTSFTHVTSTETAF